MHDGYLLLCSWRPQTQGHGVCIGVCRSRWLLRVLPLPDGGGNLFCGSPKDLASGSRVFSNTILREFEGSIVLRGVSGETGSLIEWCLHEEVAGEALHTCSSETGDWAE